MNSESRPRLRGGVAEDMAADAIQRCFASARKLLPIGDAGDARLALLVARELVRVLDAGEQIELQRAKNRERQRRYRERLKSKAGTASRDE